MSTGGPCGLGLRPQVWEGGDACVSVNVPLGTFGGEQIVAPEPGAPLGVSPPLPRSRPVQPPRFTIKGTIRRLTGVHLFAARMWAGGLGHIKGPTAAMAQGSWRC